MTFSFFSFTGFLHYNLANIIKMEAVDAWKNENEKCDNP